MNFIDALVDCLLLEAKDPRVMREVLYFLVMEQALKAKRLSIRKDWELIGSLIAFLGRKSRFPTTLEIEDLKSSINSLHRERRERTSDSLFSLKMFELGERAVKKFFTETAWKGFPGVHPDGRPLG